MLRLHPGTIDYIIIAIYFAVVLGIGFIARLAIKTDLDFFLSGRSLPAWITGLAFIAANLGALEILGQSANGAQYGVPAVHYYWIGAVPAMVFLGLIMMPFYDGAKVRSVPEYLRHRFGEPAHAFNAGTFAIATVLISGVNLIALALIIHLLLGWAVGLSILIGVVFGLGFVLSFGYWTTNFAEVQRALSAKNMSASRRTPLIGAYPKIFLPFIIILPGLIAIASVPHLGQGKSLSNQFNTAIPH